MDTTQHEITHLLEAWANGDSRALEELTPLVYKELRQIAKRHLRHQGSHSLQTTDLVHEAYLKLVRADGLRLHNRSHFFAVAAQMMRRILVDAARAQMAAKRRAGTVRITFPEDLPAVAANNGDIVALDDALRALAEMDPRKARVVELRFFGGLSVKETADALEVSIETVMRDWRIAKPWLARAMGAASHGRASHGG